MKLTSFTDYSLRVLIYLAAQPGRRATISEISQTFEISEHHLTKVAHFLGKQGWIATTRGKGGGLSLARPAREIVIGQVVRDTEGADGPAECFSGEDNACVITRCCQLKGVLSQALEAFHAVLDRFTLADITTHGKALRDVLHFHPSATAAPGGACTP